VLHAVTTVPCRLCPLLQPEGIRHKLVLKSAERKHKARQQVVDAGEEKRQTVLHFGNHMRATSHVGPTLSERNIIRAMASSAHDSDRPAQPQDPRLIIDSTPALIHTGLPDGYLDFFNQTWLKYVGLSSEDLQGWKWTAAIHPEDVDGIVERWRASIASGEPFLYEARVRRADGEYRWMLHHKIALRDEHGKIIKWYGSSIDIEDRKRAEENARQSKRELQHREAYLAEVQRISHTGSFGWRVSTGELLWSEETFRIFQYDRKVKPTVELALERVHPEDAARVKQTIERASESGEDFDFELRLLMPDGSVKHVHVVAHAISDRSDHIEFVGAVMDVTAAKLSEEKIRQNEKEVRTTLETIRALLETAAQAILIVAADGGIESVNAAAEQMFGYSRQELAGQPVEMLIPELLRDAHQHHRADYFAYPRRRPMGIGLDLTGRRKDGSEFPIEVSLSYIERENGIVAVSFITDITDRKKSETELRAKATWLQQSQDSLRALAGQLLTAQEEASRRIARELHDVFGQKMALVSLKTSEIETLLPTQPDLAAEKLRACREQIGLLTHEIQEFSRQLHPSVLHVLGLEISLRAECDAYARRTGTSVAFSAENVPEFLCEDISLCLYRVAQESLHNIWKHAESNRLAVKLRASNEEIELIVEDFGKGFDIESTKGKGGLGLISMQERVRLVGGSFAITSKAEDGTRVQVRVPLRSE
jgi:PAS domain S-box-containing protein